MSRNSDDKADKQLGNFETLYVSFKIAHLIRYIAGLSISIIVFFIH